MSSVDAAATTDPFRPFPLEPPRTTGNQVSAMRRQGTSGRGANIAQTLKDFAHYQQMKGTNEEGLAPRDAPALGRPHRYRSRADAEQKTADVRPPRHAAHH
jgi:hypothetical protein